MLKPAPSGSGGQKPLHMNVGDFWMKEADQVEFLGMKSWKVKTTIAYFTRLFILARPQYCFSLCKKIV